MANSCFCSRRVAPRTETSAIVQRRMVLEDEVVAGGGGGGQRSWSVGGDRVGCCEGGLDECEEHSVCVCLYV